jgi:hypothetical protein
MKRGTRRKRVNYYGHHYFEGDAVRALEPKPEDYCLHPDEIGVVTADIAKWNSARRWFVSEWPIFISALVVIGASLVWDYHAVFGCVLALGWLPGIALVAVLETNYGEHPGAAKLNAFNVATARWKRIAQPFAAHQRAVQPWVRMSGIDFEQAIARILKVRGIDARATKASGDGGVDVEVFGKDGRLKTIIQCKRYKSACGPALVRELYGAMQHCGAPRAMLICLGGFSPAARDFAAGKPIDLVDSKQLVEFRNGGADYLFRDCLNGESKASADST